MKKDTIIVVGLVGVIILESFLVLKTERLDARMVALEASIANSRTTSLHEPAADLELRIGRLENRITELETALEKKIVRQGLDGKLKEVRDFPSEPRH